MYIKYNFYTIFIEFLFEAFFIVKDFIEIFLFLSKLVLIEKIYNTNIIFCLQMKYEILYQKMLFNINEKKEYTMNK